MQVQLGQKPTLPSILLANVQSRDNYTKSGSISNSTRIGKKDNCIICIMKTWIPEGSQIHQQMYFLQLLGWAFMPLLIRQQTDKKWGREMGVTRSKGCQVMELEFAMCSQATRQPGHPSHLLFLYVIPICLLQFDYQLRFNNKSLWLTLKVCLCVRIDNTVDYCLDIFRTSLTELETPVHR